MATKTRKPKWTNERRRKQTERLLFDHEFMSEQEINDRKKRIAMIIRKEDTRLEREEYSLKKNGVCSKCNMYRTPKGECPMCGQMKEVN